ncbi:DUF1819 family protein [Rhizobium ruizarguesonis]|uniref:DUF1819 family protein n=1 Tax=Rhizobium ruizarguesonis TaxID=2081791 RepID=UPI001030CBF8|nr:DUF1819 family protein [Rhizobium ruizarguesonis]TBD19404.1 DUF1819 family protein [Rhizobium ruizarguesonis]TBD35032.1 DUF1819 family protein [Rhizobium ruizarguesonis]TBD56134.1 DUF1819 family protein [Rhizobium ruizarguesonis]TBF02927.1 DUF1819 family protein [Rhizobium ruizarguesonis]
MQMVPKRKYRMSFSIGGLMVNESIALARQCRPQETWPNARGRLVSEGISSFPKLASKTRVLREVFDRISQLTQAERAFLLEDADRFEQQALIWLSVCRTYDFVREFAIEVIDERFLSWRLDLGHEAFDRFLAEKADVDTSLSQLSPTTCAKLRQVLFRILRESGVLSAEGRIQQIWLSTRIKTLIQEHCPEDIRVFPGEER